MEPYLRINLGANQAGQKVGMREIVLAIGQQIRSDTSLQGCRLPPIRVLAHQLNVSKNTVTAAYEELQSQSLVVSKGRQGLYIESSTWVHSGETKKNRVPLPVFQFEGSGKTVKALRKPSPQMVLLSSPLIDPKLLPKEKMAACFRSVLKSPGLADFSDPQGYLPLRKQIAQRLNKRGIQAEPEEIVTTLGSQQALDLIGRCLTSRVVATENPAYGGAKALFQRSGIKTIGLRIDPFKGMDVEEWKRLLQKHRPGLVYLTSNYQNPTGYSYSSKELLQIVEWSQEFQFGILEDDWGSDMLSYSEFKPSLRSSGGDHVLYMNSFTKKLLPSLRIGYVLGNERSVSTLVQQKNLSIQGIPTLIEAALFEFLDRGYYDAHLKKIQQELDLRYQNCLNLLRTFMPKDVRWTSPGGGPLLWLELPKRVDIRNLAQQMAKHHFTIQLLEDAFFDRPHLHGMRLGYAFISREEMGRGIETLASKLR